MNSLINPPRQKRSRDSFELLMAAGIELLKEGGGEDFSIADLSQRTGVSVGSIYQRFGAKERIYLALQDRVLAELDSVAESLFASDRDGPDDIESAVADAVARFCGHLRRYELLFRAMISRDLTNPTALARGDLSCRKIEAAFLELLTDRVAALQGEEGRTAAQTAFRMLFSAAWSRLMNQPLALVEPEYSWDRFAETTARVLSTYLISTTR